MKQSIMLTVALAAVFSCTALRADYAWTENLDDDMVTVSGKAAKLTVGNETVYVFHEDAALSVKADLVLSRLLLVGGGGGGGPQGGGGGGAGGFVEQSPSSVLTTGTALTVDVGTGGAGSTTTSGRGTTGEDTTLSIGSDVITAYGGGGGGKGNNDTASGKDGASGGGSCYKASNKKGGQAVHGDQGFAGGWATYDGSGSDMGAGGGGGAGGKGEDAYLGESRAGNGKYPKHYHSGNGGIGRMSDITGEEVWYAGGGGGGMYHDSNSGWGGDVLPLAGMGGKGGGGHGVRLTSGNLAEATLAGSEYAQYYNYDFMTNSSLLDKYEANSPDRFDGVDGLGGGGGGSGRTDGAGVVGRGGSGCVILRVKAADKSVQGTAPVVSAVTCSGATVSGEITYLGLGAASVELFLRYGPSPEALDRTLEVDTLTTTGSYVSSLEGRFAPLSTYYVQVVAVNDLDTTEYLIGAPVLIRTKPENAGPGLWQRKLDNHGNYGGDVGFHEDVFAVAEGTTEWTRYRENGAIMAYQTGDYTSPFSGIKSGWINSQRTFIYDGFMYLEAGTYEIHSSIDDYAYFGVDGVDVHSVNEYTKDKTTVWVCTETGWHRVRLAAGDHGNGRGPMSGKSGDINGFYYVFNDDTDKHAFLEEPCVGDLFLASLPPGLKIDSASKDDASFNGQISFDDSLAGAKLYQCTGTAYGGNDTNAWALVELDPVATGEAVRPVSIAAVPEGTAYVRYLAVTSDGTLHWSDVRLWEDIEVVSASLPVAQFVGITTGIGSADFSMNVLTTGDEATTDVRFDYCLAGDEQHVQSVTATGWSVGTHVFSLTGLKPNRDYFVVATPDNGSYEGASSEPVAFTTAGDRVSPTPGLWQIRVMGNSFATDADVMGTPEGTGVGDRSRVRGAVMAYVRGGYTDAFSGLTYTWQNLNNLCFVYEGWMHLTAGSYDFVSSIDDTAYIRIGAADAPDFEHSASTYTVSKRTNWTCPETGWYPVRLLAGDNSNDAGPIDGHEADALHFSTDGGSTWSQFIDPGDGSLFRVGRNTVQANCTRTSEGVFVRLPRAELPQSLATSVSLDGAAGVAVASQLVGEDDGFVTVGPLDTGTAKTLELSVGEGVLTRRTEVLPVPAANEVRLSSEFDVNADAGICATFAGGVECAGGEATSSVKLYLSSSPEMTDAREIDIGEQAVGDTFEQRVDGLEVGTTYYYRLVASSAAGTERDVTRVTAFTTAEAPAFGVLSAVNENWNGTFTAEVVSVGPGGVSTLKLLTGASAETLTNTAEKVVTATGAQAFDVEFPFMRDTVYYRFELVNSSEAGSFAVPSEVRSVELVDTLAYYWSSSVAAGDWENAANWTDAEGIPLDARAGFPEGNGCKVRLDRASAGAVIRVNDNHTVKEIASEGGAATVIRGVGATKPTVTVVGTENSNARFKFVNSEVTLDALDVTLSPNRYRPAAGSVVRLTGGTCFQATYILHDTGANFRLIVDGTSEAVFANDRSHLCRSSKPGIASIELTGAQPYLTLNNLSAGWSDGSSVNGRITFTVPLAGYEHAPVRRASGSNDPLNAVGDKHVEYWIAADSPVWATTKALDVPLVEWSKGINTQYGHTAGYKDNLPDRLAKRLTFRFDPEGENQATKFYAHIEPIGGMIIIVR